MAARLDGTDVTILSIDGQDVLATYRECTLTISAAEIDVSAAKDTWARRNEGKKDWELTCSKVIETNEVFLTTVKDGGEVVVSAFIAGRTFTATGRAVNARATAGNDAAQIEEITIRNAGEAVSIS